MAQTQEEARNIVVTAIPDLDHTVLEDPANYLDVVGIEGPLMSITTHLTVR